MPLDDRHAPIDSPNLIGEPTAPTPGVADRSNRIATTAYVKAQQQPISGNQTITLSRDASGSGTTAIAVEITGLHGRPLTSDPPSDTEIYVWNEPANTWELKRSEEIGALPGGGAGQVQVNDGTGQFNGITISGDATLDTSSGVETVIGLQGHAVAPTPPTNLQVLTWNQVTNRWEPGIGVGTGIGIPGGGVGTLQVNDGGGNFRGITIGGDATINTTTGVETVRGLQGRGVSSVAPADGQVMTWDAGLNLWEPEDPTGGSISLDSPAFTGNPTAPTPVPGDNDTTIATTAFVGTAVGTAISGLTFAPINSPTLTGDPKAPTPSPGDNDTSIATTAFVNGAIAGLSFAPVNSPTFTGDPKAPTPATIDNDTSVATTAFVKAQGYRTGNETITVTGDVSGSGTTAITATLATVNSGVGTFAVQTVNGKGLTTAASNLSGDLTTSGAVATLATVNSNVGIFQGLTINGKGLVTAAADAGYLTVTVASATYAPLASPVLTGNPTAPTPTAGDNDTSIATTAFVTTALVSFAPLASPTLTGDPKAPTPATGDNDTSIATTAFVKAQGYQTVNSTITLTGDVSGTGTASFATTVTGLRGRAVSATAPTDTQVLTWSTSNNQWQPAPPTGSSTTVAGSNTQVQYNNSSAFGGSAGLTLDATTVKSLTFGLGTDATGDIYYRESTGLLARLAIGTAGTVLQVASGKPVWQAIGGTGAVGTGTGPQIAQYPTGPSASVGGVTLSGDATIAQGGALTLATVNANVGVFQGLTVNAKGLVTAAVDAGYLTVSVAASTYAPLASPALSGNPTAPTPTAGDNDTSIATTAFVTTALVPFAPLASPVLTGNPTAPTPAPGDSDTSIATTAFVATSFAPLANPAFTGNPTAPTPAPGDADTSIATTAFVAASFLTTATAATTYAPLASPVLTGDPRAPTPATIDNDTSIATTAFVKAQAYLTGNQNITVTGDATGSGATAIGLTLNTVNSNVGVFAACNINGKGLAIAGTALTGDVTTVGAAATLAASGVTAGTYHGIQYDAKGRAINAAPTVYVTPDTVGTNLTAGATSGAALLLTNEFNEVLTVPAGGYVRLPTAMATPGKRCRIAAYGANDLNVLPQSGQTFFAAGISNGVDQPLLIRAGQVAEYQAATATKIYLVSST